MTTLTYTPLPFVEHFVLVREYDATCLLRIHGQRQRLVGSGYERIGGKWIRSGGRRVRCEPVPLVLVQPFALTQAQERK